MVQIVNELNIFVYLNIYDESSYENCDAKVLSSDISQGWLVKTVRYIALFEIYFNSGPYGMSIAITQCFKQNYHDVFISNHSSHKSNVGLGTALILLRCIGTTTLVAKEKAHVSSKSKCTNILNHHRPSSPLHPLVLNPLTLINTPRH